MFQQNPNTKEITYIRRDKVVNGKSKVIFEATYPIENKGLVRICQNDDIDDIDDIDGGEIMIKSHDSNKILVMAEMDKEQADYHCSWEDTGCVNVPWMCDTEEDYQNIMYSIHVKSKHVDITRLSESIDYLKAVQSEILKGNGSRIKLTIKYASKFTIIVPNDSDVEVDVDEMDVTYASKRPSVIRYQCDSANKTNKTNKKENRNISYYSTNVPDEPSTFISSSGKILIG